MLQGDIPGTSKDTATEVTQAKTYIIQVDPIIHTITWGYSEEPYGADAYLEHGRATVIAIEGINDFMISHSQIIRAMTKVGILRRMPGKSDH